MSLIKIVKIDYLIYSVFAPFFYALADFGIVLKLVIMSIKVLKPVNAIVIVIAVKIVAFVAMIVWNSLIVMIFVLALVATVVNDSITLDIIFTYIIENLMFS